MHASDTQRSAFHRSRDVSGLFRATNTASETAENTARTSLENQKRKFTKQPVVGLPPNFDELLRTYEIFPMRQISPDLSSDEEFVEDGDEPPAYGANDFSFPGNTAYDQEWVGRKVAGRTTSLHSISEAEQLYTRVSAMSPPPPGVFDYAPGQQLLYKGPGAAGGGSGTKSSYQPPQHRGAGGTSPRMSPALAGIIGPNTTLQPQSGSRTGSKVSATSTLMSGATYMSSGQNRSRQRLQDAQRSQPAARRLAESSPLAAAEDLINGMAQQQQQPGFALQNGKIIQRGTSGYLTPTSMSPSKSKSGLPSLSPERRRGVGTSFGAQETSPSKVADPPFSFYLENVGRVDEFGRLLEPPSSTSSGVRGSATSSREVLVRLSNGRVTSESPDAKRANQIRRAAQPTVMRTSANSSRQPRDSGYDDDQLFRNLNGDGGSSLAASLKLSYPMPSGGVGGLGDHTSPPSKRNSATSTSQAESILQQAGLHAMTSQLGKHHPHHPRNKHQTRKTAQRQPDLDVNWHSLPGV
mmetsp:Transcript_4361/g.10672  ORF Transcript_4361/g.10672 Transcript_4361/m.10672 type:complete len:523 (-) Transcript_4361:509-2077(-)|eukprot:CAMPEP_0178987100 /NCGR_PEP_ID=MMETSP0795-20121207/3071_1 /TAXON_ID=88552 /ORGANISM="Amoebophrya sp., Strain Ameob2" /LENGTH=522 /DNA_ID=CAMNT_0020678233 /DNA_START=179 /DNA_END=1747 /DNA_ORIENTATION=+